MAGKAAGRESQLGTLNSVRKHIPCRGASVPGRRSHPRQAAESAERGAEGARDSPGNSSGEGGARLAPAATSRDSISALWRLLRACEANSHKKVPVFPNAPVTQGPLPALKLPEAALEAPSKRRGRRAPWTCSFLLRGKRGFVHCWGFDGFVFCRPRVVRRDPWVGGSVWQTQRKARCQQVERPVLGPRMEPACTHAGMLPYDPGGAAPLRLAILRRFPWLKCWFAYFKKPSNLEK